MEHAVFSDSERLSSAFVPGFLFGNLGTAREAMRSQQRGGNIARKGEQQHEWPPGIDS